MYKAILFDMVGPLLVKRSDYVSDGTVEVAENLFSADALEKESQLIEKIVDKYCKVEKVWSELLPQLKKKYKLGVINNGASVTVPFFKSKHPFDRYFDIFLNSDEEKMSKPDAGIYLLACEKLGVLPQDCVFIDDLAENVEGAKALGMTGIVYTNYDILISQLTELKII